MIKKFLVGTAVALAAVAVSAPPAQAAEAGKGHAYGRTVHHCFEMPVGDAIAAGKLAHPGAKMTAKTLAESPHCSKG